MRGLFKMLLSDSANAHPADGDEAVVESDEPPDDQKPANKQADDQKPYTKSKLSIADSKKESLLTRALLSSPELSPVEKPNPMQIPRSHNGGNQSAPSTAELTSDGETTSPLRSHTPSPPHPTQYSRLPPTGVDEKVQPKPVAIANPQEGGVEANLGRKRCITFACGRKPSTDDDVIKSVGDTSGHTKEPEAPKRKSALKFVCPAPTRQADSDDNRVTKQKQQQQQQQQPPHRPSLSSQRKPVSDPVRVPQTSRPTFEASRSPNITVTGLGEFQHCDATRFHEFGSSLDEDEDWVNETTQGKPKITLSDCMRKENAIRELGEEAEAEARRDEDEDEDEDEEDDEDEDEDNEGDDNDGDVSTVLQDFSDDGNESDNEAGFASDDDSDEDSEYDFWAPAMTTAATSVDHVSSSQYSTGRRHSDDSIELEDPNATPLAHRKKPRGHPINSEKSRPSTPNLPDSTDFVCGTLDEDRPLEAAYKSRMEERRRMKLVTVPQDIDPSFPTSDPEDEDDDEEDEDENDENEDAGSNAAPSLPKNGVQEHLDSFEFRGRQKGDSNRTSPSHSPGSRQPSPGRKHQGRSPRRLRSPPPPTRKKSPAPDRRPSANAAHPARGPGINISGLAQRPTKIRTKSLPRTPNPFFARLEQAHRSSKAAAPPKHHVSNRNHTRGAVDIVAGLEKKRQKRKEKFWRQHCRKAAKEQQERRPQRGRGAERMKEVGLELAERFRAYGFDQDTRVVISI